MGKGIYNEPEYCERVGVQLEEHESVVRIDISQVLVKIKVLGRNKIHISVLSKSCAQMSQLIPEWVISMATENTMLEMFQNIRRLTKKFKGSEYEKLMKEKPEFFDYLASRVKAHLDKRYGVEV